MGYRNQCLALPASFDNWGAENFPFRSISKCWDSPLKPEWGGRGWWWPRCWCTRWRWRWAGTAGRRWLQGGCSPEGSVCCPTIGTNQIPATQQAGMPGWRGKSHSRVLLQFSIPSQSSSHANCCLQKNAASAQTGLFSRWNRNKHCFPSKELESRRFLVHYWQQIIIPLFGSLLYVVNIFLYFNIFYISKGIWMNFLKYLYIDIYIISDLMSFHHIAWDLDNCLNLFTPFILVAASSLSFWAFCSSFYVFGSLF